MTISELELNKERLILSKVSKLLNKTLDDLAIDTVEKEEDLKEFKKLVWQDSNTFDYADINQAVDLTQEEANKLYRKQKYFNYLKKIENKPYFASIVFKDNDGDIYNIYISITYLKDKNLNNILYDWRSPIASLFYDYEVGNCSYQAPGGIISGELKRKRQYRIENNKLLGVFDNSLNIDDEVLQEVLLTESNDKMKNVVNTIQKEQNKVIRNLEDNTLIVQGIAGSGKTTVALHRIAFLLYRIKNITSNNILIFSPNNIFTEYISDVLPSLGENNTLETTFNDYLSTFITEYKNIETFIEFTSRYYKNEEIDPSLVKYKQSDEIITDLDNYLNEYIKNAKYSKDIVENNINKVSFVELNNMLHYKYDRFPLFERVEEISKRLSSNFYNGSMKKVKTFNKLLRESANFIDDYKKIYKDFWLSKYAKIKLSERFINSFINKDILSYDDALLFAYIKGTLHGFMYEANIKQVVIDEAQDYNKLQYIIINKIFKKANFTILGDVNQNINPYYKYQSLEELKDIFINSNYLELLKTYRSSPSIIEYTNKILNLKHVNAIRRDNGRPVVIRHNVSDLKKILVQDIKNLQNNYKSTAIITKDDIEARKLYELIKDDIDISLIDMDTYKFRKDLVIIPAYIAKGLEFDSVIIYNNRNNSYKKTDKNLLYVACTRCQHELYIYN